MKRLLVFALCCLSTGAVLGQAETENPPVNVTLAAAPAPAQGQTFGTAVGLTATVTPRKLMPQKLFSVAAQRIRYNFKVQRTWPCAEDVTIVPGSSDASNASVTWSPAKAGEYKITVDVYYAESRLTTLPLKDIAASASINTYVVKPPVGTDFNIILTASPPTNSTVSFPVNVTLSASVNPPGEPAINKWRFKFECQGCNPPRSNAIETSASSASWTTSVSTAGQHNLFVYVDKILVSGCVWKYAGLRYDYGYFLQAQ